MSDRPLTHRRVLGIALPIVLSNVTVPLLGIVDTGVVGQLGAAAPIGAVGLGAIILTAVYWVFGFLRMGTTGLTAQAFGAGEAAEVSALLVRSLLVGGAAGMAIIALQVPIIMAGFGLSPASAEVEALAAEYVRVRIWSAPAAIALYGVMGWLIGQERTRAVLWVQIGTNALNILLDLWFVLGLGLGVSGVAAATVIAEWSGLALGLWVCRDAFAPSVQAGWARILDRVRLRRMIAVNGDIMVRSILLQAIFLSFVMWSGGLGDVTLAANQVLLQFLYVTAYGLDGFAFAAEALVGQAVGARATLAFRRAVWMSAVWGAVVCVGMSLGFWLFGAAIVEAMADNVPVQDEARRYLGWIIAAPVLGWGAWMLDGVFIGATRTRDMRNMMVVSAGFYFAIVGPLMWSFGGHGLWMALVLSFVVRGVTLALRFPAIARDMGQPENFGKNS